MNKLSRLTSVIALAGLLFSGASAATAAPSDTSLATASVSSTTDDSQLQARLLDGNPETVLIDVETGKVLEITPTKSWMTPFIYQIGFGCTTSSLCIYGKNSSGTVTPWGYADAGSLAVNIPAVNHYYNGQYTTQLKWKVSSSSGVVTSPKMGPGKTNILTGNANVTNVQIF